MELSTELIKSCDKPFSVTIACWNHTIILPAAKNVLTIVPTGGLLASKIR